MANTKLACTSVTDQDNNTFVLHLVDTTTGKKKKALQDSNLVKGWCISLGFNYDGKYIVSLSAGPYAKIFVWLVEKVLRV